MQYGIVAYPQQHQTSDCTSNIAIKSKWKYMHWIIPSLYLTNSSCLKRVLHRIWWKTERIYACYCLIMPLGPNTIPYPEPVYTGWSSVHWNATGMPLVDPVYTGIPLEKLSWNSPTLECHWRNLVESAPHWDATGETLTFAAYTGTPLEGLWQPTHAPTHIVKYAE